MNTHDYSLTHFHTDIQYGFITREDPIGQPNDGESIDLRWLTHEEIRNLDDTQVFTNTIEIYDYMFTEILKNWEPVPATDYILEYPREYFE